MKTSVKSIMMSLALIGCLFFSASDAKAQGRTPSHGGNSNVDRTTVIPQGNRNTNSRTVVDNSDTQQVDRTTNSSTVSGRTVTPHVNRNTNDIVSPDDDDHSTGMATSSTLIRKGDATTRPGTSTQSGSGGNGGRPGNGGNSGNSSTPSGGSGRPGGGGSPSGSSPGGGTPGGGTPGGGSPGGGPSMPPGGGGPSMPPGGGPSMPPSGGPSMPPPPVEEGPGMPPPPDFIVPDLPPLTIGDYFGYGPMNPYDYSGHPYESKFSWNYEHHNWSSSLPPIDRPSFRGWFRPVIPAGWHPKAAAPVIDGILGIPFGTLLDDALDYLYSHGYYIDGYANSIIYLKKVPMLRMTWDDVMLAFDNQGRLVNAEFIIGTSQRIAYHYYNINMHYGYNCRNDGGYRFTPSNANGTYNNDGYDYNRAYRRLCQIFGTPFNNSSGSVSLYGRDNTGWITLLTYSNSDNLYTMLSIGQ